MNQALPQQVQACQSQSSFSGVETIEWPFLKAARDGGDPEVPTAAASDNESTQPSSTGPPCHNGAIKKSNYFERKASEIDTKIEKDEEESYGGEGYFFARTSTRKSHSRTRNRTHERVATKRLGDIEIRGFADDCVERYEFIKDVSTKDMIVSDGNDTETSTFGVINDENEVKN